jgi:hypothetical protein
MAYTCNLINQVIILIDLGIENWVRDTLRQATAGLKPKPDNLFASTSRHVGLLMPHEEFIFETEDTNKGLVGQLECQACQVNMHGGIHFEKVMELKHTCQALLYQNIWINDDEDDHHYLLDIMPLIQNKVDVYNIYNPQQCSMTTIINK